MTHNVQVYSDIVHMVHNVQVYNDTVHMAHNEQVYNETVHIAHNMQVRLSICGARGGAVGLRHRATSRKVVGSIPYGVIGIFHLHNPSGPTMALGLTQPLTETNTRNVSRGVKAAGA
jgi:hypothetical protein